MVSDIVDTSAVERLTAVEMGVSGACVDLGSTTPTTAVKTGRLGFVKVAEGVAAAATAGVGVPPVAPAELELELAPPGEVLLAVSVAPALGEVLAAVPAGLAATAPVAVGELSDSADADAAEEESDVCE